MSVRFDWKPKVGKDGKIQFNTADGVPVRKHGEGDQKPHGNWASKMGRRVGYTLGVGDWESTKPWTWSKEQFENTPGWELYDSDRPVLASNQDDFIRIYPAFFTVDEETRRQTLYHEVGHDIANSVLGDSRWKEALAPFGDENPQTVRTTYDPSYGGASQSGFGQNAEETLSDVYVYASMYPETYLVYEDPEWNEHGRKLRDLVLEHAERFGYPTSLPKPAPSVKKNRVAALIRKHPGSDGGDIHDTGTTQAEHAPKSTAQRRVTPAAFSGEKNPLRTIATQIGRSTGKFPTTHELLTHLADTNASFDYGGMKVRVAAESDFIWFGDKDKTPGHHSFYRSPNGEWSVWTGRAKVKTNVDDFIAELARTGIVAETSIPLPEISDADIAEYLKPVTQNRHSGSPISYTGRDINPTTFADLEDNDRAMFPFANQFSSEYKERTDQGKKNVAALMERIGGAELQNEWSDLVQSFRDTLTETYDNVWTEHTGQESLDGFAPDGTPTWMKGFMPVEMVGQTVMPGFQEAGLQEPGTISERISTKDAEVDVITESTPRDITNLHDLIDFGGALATTEDLHADDVPLAHLIDAAGGGGGVSSPLWLVVHHQTTGEVNEWSGQLGVETTSDGDDTILSMLTNFTKADGTLGIEDWVQHTRDKWASSSTHPESLAVQYAANELFGLDADQAHFGDASFDGEQIYERLPILYETYVQAAYVNTQAGFKKLGITHVPVIRGMGLTAGDDFDPTDLEMADSGKPADIFRTYMVGGLGDTAGMGEELSAGGTMDELWRNGTPEELRWTTEGRDRVELVPFVAQSFRNRHIATVGDLLPEKATMEASWINQARKEWGADMSIGGTPAFYFVGRESSGLPVRSAEQLYGVLARGSQGDWYAFSVRGAPPSTGVPFEDAVVEQSYAVDPQEYDPLKASELLARGFQNHKQLFEFKSATPKWSKIESDLQPLSAFSTSTRTARQFESPNDDDTHSALVRGEIPVERVWAHSVDGFGSLGEHEIIVLGGTELPFQFLAWEPPNAPTGEIEKAAAWV